jgi:hypothetical protein
LRPTEIADGQGVVSGHRERFLDDDVFAGLEGEFGELAVAGVGGGE